METKYGAVPENVGNIQEKPYEMPNPLKNPDILLGDKDSKERQLLTDNSYRRKEYEKFKKMTDAATNRAPPAILPYLKKMEPCLAGCAVCCEVTVPIYARCFSFVATVISKLPQDELAILYGLLLCFFGGMYPLTLAAVEAWIQCGGKEANQAALDLISEIVKAKNAIDEDDKHDADDDGIPDIETSGQAIAQRKTFVVLKATDPVKLDNAVVGVYTAAFAVIAVLKLRFAWMIAIGNGIGEMMKKVLITPATNLLVHVLDDDIHKWIPNIVGYSCKIIGIIVAFSIQVVISAFYSAIRGGLLVSRNVMRVMQRLKLCKFCNLDPESSYIDEVAGWAIAAVGFFVQFKLGFSMPFIISILLWPIGFLEGCLLWVVYT